VTTLSTWSFELPGRLIGCGVDAERVDRFRPEASGQRRPWELVFTGREVSHCDALDRPELGLCAAFCCKEAIIKAVGVPIDYRHCELLFRPARGPQQQPVALSRTFLEEHDAEGGVARIMLIEGDEECVVAACVYRRG
jgi:phosphopantetheinyl transferase (holo-ACP synthase)